MCGLEDVPAPAGGWHATSACGKSKRSWRMTGSGRLSPLFGWRDSRAEFTAQWCIDCDLDALLEDGRNSGSATCQLYRFDNLMPSLYLASKFQCVVFTTARTHRGRIGVHTD